MRKGASSATTTPGGTTGANPHRFIGEIAQPLHQGDKPPSTRVGSGAASRLPKERPVSATHRRPWESGDQCRCCAADCAFRCLVRRVIILRVSTSAENPIAA